MPNNFKKKKKKKKNQKKENETSARAPVKNNDYRTQYLDTWLILLKILITKLVPAKPSLSSICRYGSNNKPLSRTLGYSQCTSLKSNWLHLKHQAHQSYSIFFNLTPV